MSHEATIALPAPPKTSTATWVGLVLSLFSMLIIRQVTRLVVPDPGPGAVFAKEVLIWISAGVLIRLILRWEGLPLSSIGIGTSKAWKSVGWGFAAATLSLAAGLFLAHLTQYGHGDASKAFDKLPLWLITLIVIRAGVVEELFYRGYAIERLQQVGLPRAAAVLLPLIIFSLGHWTGGAANILIAFVIGAILTAFYLWRRDLNSNMFAHFLVDFVGNVVPKLFA
ncbi:MAG TPA: type II CAAX endopeptidase family protein [Terriglobales bacterium]|nr:type II CAAX endopeptidase family protein [Terriglobales bacterium]